MRKKYQILTIVIVLLLLFYNYYRTTFKVSRDFHKLKEISLNNITKIEGLWNDSISTVFVDDNDIKIISNLIFEIESYEGKAKKVYSDTFEVKVFLDSNESFNFKLYAENGSHKVYIYFVNDGYTFSYLSLDNGAIDLLKNIRKE